MLGVNWCFVILTMSTTMRSAAMAASSIHFKCRGGFYPRSNISRTTVLDDEVPWSVELPNYDPRDYTSPSIHGKPWADPPIDDPKFKPKWHSIDDNVSRESYLGNYKIENGRPLNPVGRTGLRGRGILGRWGPNHAADPVVTRWKTADGEPVLDTRSKKPILQFVAVKRRDNGQWALPGGMVDPGEKITATAIREFREEATNSLVMTDDEKEAWKQQFEAFFSAGEDIYRGYVDDPRNTDNSWMETAAYNFHDQTGHIMRTLVLVAGDDAVGASWTDMSEALELYASHRDIIEKVARLRNAHW